MGSTRGRIEGAMGVDMTCVGKAREGAFVGAVGADVT